MFNIINRAKKQIKKLCEYHNRKADKYEALAKHYAEKAGQHRTAANAFMSGSTTLEIETLDVGEFDRSLGSTGLIVDGVQVPVFDPRHLSFKEFDRRVAEAQNRNKARNVQC